jgi:hypothetical protein
VAEQAERAADRMIRLRLRRNALVGAHLRRRARQFPDVHLPLPELTPNTIRYPKQSSPP